MQEGARPAGQDGLGSPKTVRCSERKCGAIVRQQEIFHRRMDEVVRLVASGVGLIGEDLGSLCKDSICEMHSSNGKIYQAILMICALSCM